MGGHTGCGQERSWEGAPATQIKCTSPGDRFISSFDVPAVCQGRDGCFPTPGLAASRMEGPAGPSITRHTWSAHGRQQVGRGSRAGGGGRGAGSGPQAEREALRQDLRPLAYPSKGCT